MKTVRLLSCLAFLLVASAVSAQVPEKHPKFLKPGTLTIHVRNAGVDEYGCGTTVLRACNSIEGVLNQIPTGYKANVLVNLGDETYNLPTIDFSTQPSMWIDSNNLPQEGKVRIMGACTTPIHTFVTSGSGTAVTNRYTQTTYSVGAWVGTITDGTHYVRWITSTTNSAYTYAAARTSTSPNLVIVRNLTTAFPTSPLPPAEVCPWTSLINTPTGTRFNGAITGNESTNVIFEGVKFSNATTMRNVTVSASHFTAVSTMNDSTVQNSYLIGTQFNWTTSRVNSNSTVNLNHFVGCLNLKGLFATVGNLYTPSSSCTSAPTGVLTMAALAASASNHVAPSMPSTEMQLGANDIESSQASHYCIRMSNSVARLGVSSASSISCVMAGANSGFIWANNNSRFGTHLNAAITGTVTLASSVDSGATIGPMNGFTLTNSTTPGSDFTIGPTKTFAVADLPVVDSISGAAVYINSITSASKVYTGRPYDTVVCANAASPAVCTTATSGYVLMPSAGTTLTINTTAVTALSQISVFDDVTQSTTLGGATCNTDTGRIYSIVARNPGVSFQIKSSAALNTNPACLGWSINKN